jgi:hypothetical protein
MAMALYAHVAPLRRFQGLKKYVDRTQYIDQEIITRLDMVNEKGDHEVWHFEKQEPEFKITLMAETCSSPDDCLRTSGFNPMP